MITQSTGLRSPAEKPRPKPTGGKTAELLEQRETKETPSQAEGTGGTEQGSAPGVPHRVRPPRSGRRRRGAPRVPSAPAGSRSPGLPRAAPAAREQPALHRPACPQQHLLAQVDEHPGGARGADPGRLSGQRGRAGNRVPLATAGGNGAASGGAAGRH